MRLCRQMNGQPTRKARRAGHFECGEDKARHGPGFAKEVDRILQRRVAAVPSMARGSRLPGPTIADTEPTRPLRQSRRCLGGFRPYWLRSWKMAQPALSAPGRLLRRT